MREPGAKAFVYAGSAAADSLVASGDVVARGAPARASEKGERSFLCIRDGEQCLFSVGSGERIDP